MSERTLAIGLRNHLHGQVIEPGDADYEQARRVWNGMIDRRPALIARCLDPDDVARAIRFAVKNDLPIAVRGGGHNVAGFGTCDGGLVIDLSPMDRITVDVAARTARAQGGLRWGAFDRATQAHGLATTGGLVSTTGIGGFTLGGGIGWLMRKHGLALDNLLSVEMVTAAGERVKASERENADLFWGVRGGGGNFGVVTEFTYRLHPVGPAIFGGVVLYPRERAQDLLHVYRDWVKTLPDETTTMAVCLSAPPAPFVPEPLRGTPMVGIGVCHAGAAEQGETLVRPLRTFATPAIDLLGPMPYTALQGMFDESVPAGISSYWKTEYLGDLTDGAIGTLVDTCARLPGLHSQVHVHHVEGAVKRVEDGATAFGHRDTPFILNVIGLWTDAAETDRQIAWARTAAQAMQPHVTGAVYLNFLGDEGEKRVRAAYGERKYARLVELKERYDPQNRFRLNQNIRPRG